MNYSFQILPESSFREVEWEKIVPFGDHEEHCRSLDLLKCFNRASSTTWVVFIGLMMNFSLHVEWQNCTLLMWFTTTQLQTILELNNKWFKPRSNIPWLKMIISVIGVLRLLLATDVSTTCAEDIFRVKWSFVVSWKFTVVLSRQTWRIQKGWRSEKTRCEKLSFFFLQFCQMHFKLVFSQIFGEVILNWAFYSLKFLEWLNGHLNSSGYYLLFPC